MAQQSFINLFINYGVVIVMNKDIQELDRMMKELKEINKELNDVHLQMTEQLSKRVSALEDIVLKMASRKGKEVTVERIVTRYRITSDGETLFDEEVS